MVTNLDELRRMRDAAMAKGAGSKPWIDFATAMLDAFPRLYETAQKMNDEAAHLRAQIYLAVMDERNACIGICAQYRGADGDSIASEIEARLPPNWLISGAGTMLDRHPNTDDLAAQVGTLSESERVVVKAVVEGLLSARKQ